MWRRLIRDEVIVPAPVRDFAVRLLLATSGHFFVYPTKLREYQARYRGSFLHGGVFAGLPGRAFVRHLGDLAADGKGEWIVAR